MATALEKGRAFFLSKEARAIGIEEAAEICGCSTHFVRTYVLAVLRHEGLVHLARRNGAKGLYQPVAREFADVTIREQALVLLKRKPMTIKELTEVTGGKRRHVFAVVSRMVERGELEQVGEVVTSPFAWKKSAVYGVCNRPPVANEEPDDPLVTDPLVRNIVPAPSVAADVRAVLEKQPALVGAWK